MRIEPYIADVREKAYSEGYKEGYDEGYKEGYDEGRKESYDEGRKEAYDEKLRLNAALAAALVSAGREDEAVAVLLDPEVREKLLEELGIE